MMVNPGHVVRVTWLQLLRRGRNQRDFLGPPSSCFRAYFSALLRHLSLSVKGPVAVAAKEKKEVASAETATAAATTTTLPATTTAAEAEASIL